MLHIILKSRALSRRRGRVVQPQNNLILLQDGRVQVIPIRRCFEVEMISFGHLFEKRYGLRRKVHMILFHMRGVKGESMKRLVLAEGDCCGENQNSHKAERAHLSNHRWTFLAAEN